MVHPDYQYDPTLLPEIIKPIQEGKADVVFGSRLMGTNPMKQGMPWWKYISNRFLTIAENTVFGLNLSEYHTGYRAFRREALEAVNLQMDSDKFIFDQEIVAQLVNIKMRITEVPVPDAVLRAGFFGLFFRQHALRHLDPVAAAALRSAPLSRDPPEPVRQSGTAVPQRHRNQTPGTLI